MAEGFAPQPGFDWGAVNWVAPDQPLIAAGEDAERCSYCGDAIPEESVPLRLWNKTGWGAVFCDHCQIAWWGLHGYEEPAEPRHEPEVPTPKGPKNWGPKNWGPKNWGRRDG